MIDIRVFIAARLIIRLPTGARRRATRAHGLARRWLAPPLGRAYRKLENFRA